VLDSLGVVATLLLPVLAGSRYSKPYSLISGEEVSQISKVEQPQVKRMNLNVPLDLHNQFKSITASQGQNMTDVLLQFIENYVEKHSPAPAKKGRRG
jgi:hypothetical protein